MRRIVDLSMPLQTEIASDPSDYLPEIDYSDHQPKLHNLKTLPAHGFEVACFPVKVHRASAGWTQAVAILEEAGP
jgi:hypothetical protein